MKLADLQKLSEIEKFAHLLTLQRIAPEFGKDIIYKSNYWDGILSGTLRWNGALLHFDCIMDEFQFATPRCSESWDLGDEFDSTTNTTRRYYAVVAYSDAVMMQVVRRAVSFRRRVNPRSDYRYVARHKGSEELAACRDPQWRTWYDRKWPEIPAEPYDGEVIGWFTL